MIKYPLASHIEHPTPDIKVGPVGQDRLSPPLKKKLSAKIFLDFFYIFLWVKIGLHTKNQLPGTP